MEPHEWLGGSILGEIILYRIGGLGFCFRSPFGSPRLNRQLAGRDKHQAPTGVFVILAECFHSVHWALSPDRFASGTPISLSPAIVASAS